MSILGVIPSRYHSTRFPGKPLVEIGGRLMIQRVYEQCLKCKKLDRVIVATDDKRIFNAVLSFGGQVFMTSPQHQNGTERCGEVAELMSEYKTFINIQGDEPFIHEEAIDALCEVMNHAKIGTLAKRITEVEDLTNPSVIKVAITQGNLAQYFSRSPIPHLRGVDLAEWPIHKKHFRHIGIYGFERDTLLELVRLPATELEQTESLEQLRWLEHNYDIHVGLTEHETLGIDTPEDLERSQAWI